MKKGKLFILSNRLPVTVTKREGRLKILPSSGGLVSAMQGFLQNAGKADTDFQSVNWVGVPGCSKEIWDTIKDDYKEDYKLIPVYIPSKIYDGYYNGMSNSVIWPLFHYFPSYAEYSETAFKLYLQANGLFMESLSPNLSEGDTVWIHDYQLMPLAKMIREKFPNITIGFFLHIPFPSFELFRLLPHPWQDELLHGMLGADLVGFHTIDYATHFLKSLQMKLGLEHDNSILKYNDRLVKVDVFPISIDYEKFRDAYSSPEVVQRRDFYAEQFEGKKIIFSVDRLDYSKNVLGRLKGYERFLLQYPHYKEKVVFILAIVPSRDNIANYIERKKEIDEFIGGFNARAGNIVWKPVIYQYAHLPFEEMIALYSCCNIALITPLRDGMNLVSKEFVATRRDKRGVLVLSEMAGAARELTDAVLINPNDVNGLAEKMYFALEMPEDEQERRMVRMQQRISEYSVSVWAEDFLEQLEKIKKQQSDFEFIFLDQPAREVLKERFLRAKKRLILLDYDGTLVNFAPLP
ncbi:MAG: bifunctional alpha,alpha-trehalose-phosphate synthase (UDP-forming)/trehalose-phosphatase, partial [Chitinophagaceae bacterium]